MTSVTHTNTRFRGITHCPCSGCENGVNKSELSFDIWWLYLNGTTPHLFAVIVVSLQVILQVDKSRQTGVNFLTKASRTDLACVQ